MIPGPDNGGLNHANGPYVAQFIYFSPEEKLSLEEEIEQ